MNGTHRSKQSALASLYNLDKPHYYSEEWRV
jgi:hypothetical protein